MAATRRVLVTNKKGLHARAAAKLVKTANEFQSRINVTRLPRVNEKMEPSTVTARSILGLLMLAAEPGVELELTADGPDEALALAALEELIGNKFGEGE